MQHAKYLSMSVLVIFTLSACTTMQPVKESSTTEEIINEIVPGTEILLVTDAGDKRYITVSSISEGYIFSEDESYKLEDIEIIEVTRLNTTGKAVAVVGGIGLALLMQYLIAAIVVVVAL
jgi:hypothetical protein